MAPKSLVCSLRAMNNIYSQQGAWVDPLNRCLIPRLSRTMATEVAMPTAYSIPFSKNISPAKSDTDLPVQPFTRTLTTIYRFPSMKPLRFEYYPCSHLYLPLRRDLLHRAVIYEGDATRQGTASTKWRGDVHGSGRKLRPQKGMGRARVGDKKSPIMRGGGVAFGPHPRDFSTQLPRKMYDLAWRTALSYRYRKGELIVVDGEIELERSDPRYAQQLFEDNHWGNADGRSLIVTTSLRHKLFNAVSLIGADGRVLEEKDVDVKDLLELGRVIIEKQALDVLLENHQSDLIKSAPSATYM